MLTENIERSEQRLADVEREEQVTDASDWERLAAIRNERKSLEDSILELYLEKEAMEKEPPAE
jgi:hypothetical protein